MRMFETVVIVCDQSTLDIAVAIRGMLELFRLRANLLFCVQKQNVLEALAGELPEADYVVLCAGALREAPERTLFFRVVDRVNEQWQEVAVLLNRETVPHLVNLPGRTVIALGCETGEEALANAFLDAGCTAYIASTAPVDQDAVAMFSAAFFYHLLREERDPKLTCTAGEACQLAAALDTRAEDGTGGFRYYTREITVPATESREPKVER